MQWKDLVGYEGFYIISSTGVIKSKKTSTIRKPWLHKGKWLRVSLYKNGVRRNERVHRLVAITFIPNPDNKPEINHIDLNKHNNSADNLEWVTSEENIRHYQYSTIFKEL
jgi:hypothetical protein